MSVTALLQIRRVPGGGKGLQVSGINRNKAEVTGTYSGENTSRQEAEAHLGVDKLQHASIQNLTKKSPSCSPWVQQI